MQEMTMTVSTNRIYEYLKEVHDPEIPVLNLIELGVVRDVKIEDGNVQIDITPTYSGCPAMKMMEEEIVSKLKSKGFHSVTVKQVYSPAWTTDWMTEEAKSKLKNYGIAPPGKVSAEDRNPFHHTPKPIACPYCDSQNTQLTSQFGSTACKSLYYCHNCQQPFEHFKCI